MKKTKIKFRVSYKRAIISKISVVLLIIVFLSGCYGGNDISSAYLLDYNESSFEETMNRFVKDMIESNEENVDIDFSCGWKEGWTGKDAPNAGTLMKNEKPMTYIMSIKLTCDEEIETNRLIYYMIHNKKTNTLLVQGGSFDEDGDVYPMSMKEARDDLKDIFDEYN